LKELLAHLDQRIFSKLEHNFTVCIYHQFLSLPFSVNYILLFLS
jgi:hypothetical protein